MDVLRRFPLLLLFGAIPTSCRTVLCCAAAGVSNLVSDRDFVLRAVRVFFPKGMCVLSVHSVGPEEEVAGDPGPAPRMIRWGWGSTSNTAVCWQPSGRVHASAGQPAKAALPSNAPCLPCLLGAG